MRKEKYISVIIPTYNRKKFIIDAIESILIQDIDQMEIIVIDDGSTDDTKYILKPYLKDIRYIYQDHQGVSAAINRGVRESQGELISFLASDDLWLPGKLKAQINKVSSDDVLSFEGVEFFVDRDEDRILLKQSENVKWPRCNSNGYVIDPILDVAEGRYFHMATLLCHKSAFLKVGFLDETLCMGEDEDWISRASLMMRFHYIPTPFLKRRLHPKQTNAESEESIRSQIKVFRNMKARTRGIHPKACVAVNLRLAAKWSHLANCLASQGRRIEASYAAWTAFVLEPLRFKRLIKAGLMLMGWKP